jgi:hypothetical protein
MFYSLLAFLLHTSFVTAKDNIQEKQKDQKVPQKGCVQRTYMAPVVNTLTK